MLGSHFLVPIGEAFGSVRIWLKYSWLKEVLNEVLEPCLVLASFVGVLEVDSPCPVAWAFRRVFRCELGPTSPALVQLKCPRDVTIKNRGKVRSAILTESAIP